MATAASDTLGVTPSYADTLAAVARSSESLSHDHITQGQKIEGLPLYRLTVDPYEQMARHGILDERSRVVLIDGLLVAKMTKNTPQEIAKDLISRSLFRIIPDNWYTSNQDSLFLQVANCSSEPDLMILRGSPNDRLHRRIAPADLGVLIDVADSSLRIDHSVTKQIYASGSAPEYWIVNLVDRRVEAYSDPTGPDPTPDYRRRQEFGPEDQVPLVLDGREVGRIAVRDILPLTD